MKTLITFVLLPLSVWLSTNLYNKPIDKTMNQNIVEMKELPKPIQIELQDAETDMVQSDQIFAFNLFSKVFEEESEKAGKNFMISPFSLRMALAMTLNGASGETKLAIQHTIGVGECHEDAVNGYFNKLKNGFQQTDSSTQISIANSIWTNKNINLLSDFLSVNRSYYNATIESTDFNQPSTVDKINKWASENTNGLINKVIDETKPSDLMFLLNAIYFKGAWTSEFDTKNTSKMDFITDDCASIKVDMMHQESIFNYTQDEIMQLVELPYGNEAFSMLVLLPKADKSLNDITKHLTEKRYWNTLKNSFYEAKVDLYIPKFKTVYSKKLNDILSQMGMEIAFSPGKADFSKISKRESYISLVNQDTYIATDEVGTEAAAVTSVGMSLTSIRPQPKKVVFKADRPFIFLIQENSTGVILFMGAIKSF